MREHQVEDDEAILILGEDRIELHSAIMDDPEKMTLPIPEHIQFATALVWLIKTDSEFRAWVTEKWFGLVEKWMEEKAEKEQEDEV